MAFPRRQFLHGAAASLGLSALPRRRPLDLERFQVCPKDLPAALRQGGRAENRPHGPVGGADSA